MSYIYVTPIDPIKPVYYTDIGQAIEGAFDIPHKIFKANIKSETAYDYSREQYNSTFLLSKILEFLPENTKRIVGITDIDLFVPVLTFVFGEAQLNGKAAIVSISRLKNEFYGLPKNEQLLLDRIKKEVIHELGHTFGLFHCKNYSCVMSSSMYVENIDLKSYEFCNECRDILNNNITNQISSD